MGVEVFAVVGKVFILNYRIAYAGAEINDSHGRQGIFKGFIELTACSMSTLAGGKVDGKFNGMVIGCAILECTCIGVADNMTISDSCQIRIFGKCFGDASLKFR